MAAGILLATAVFLVLARRPIERLLVYAPTRILSTTPASLGLSWEEIPLQTKDGERLVAWHVRVAEPRGLVLHFHGNGGNIQDRLPLAAAFAREHLDTLLVDYRGYGASTGAPWEEGLYLDAEAAFSWGVRQSLPMALYGESLGGGVVAELALRRSASAVVLQSTFTSLADMADTMVPVLGGLLVRQRFDNAHKVPLIRQPILIIHGQEDTLVPPAMAARLFQLAPTQREYLLVPDAAHNDVVAHAASDIARRVASLLTRNTGRFLQGPL